MRIDNYLYENNKFSSRTKAKEAVERGEVLVNGRAVKPSFDVSDSDTITFAEDAGIYVSNGAFKLEKALNDFDFNVLGKTFALRCEKGFCSRCGGKPASPVTCSG